MEVAGMFMEKNTNVQDEYIEELKKKGRLAFDSG